MSLFSIIITSYNQGQFIREAVDSAIALKGDREIIVVDDASTDGSDSLLMDYGKSIRLILRKQNGGVVSARMEGCRRAGGEYYVFLDGDDAFLPHALDVYAAVIKDRLPDVILGEQIACEDALPAIYSVARDATFVEYARLSEKDRRFRITASAMIIRHSAYWASGGWLGDVFPAEDLDLLLRLGLNTAAHVMSPPTIFYRLHGGNSVRNVKPFVRAFERIIRRSHDNRQYLGSKFAIAACIGGPLRLWIANIWKSGDRRGALRLLRKGWPLLLAKFVQQAMLALNGRTSVETVAW